jgi:hypothetical protein
MKSKNVADLVFFRQINVKLNYFMQEPTLDPNYRSVILRSAQDSRKHPMKRKIILPDGKRQVCDRVLLRDRIPRHISNTYYEVHLYKFTSPGMEIYYEITMKNDSLILNLTYGRLRGSDFCENNGVFCHDLVSKKYQNKFFRIKILAVFMYKLGFKMVKLI